MSLVITRTSLTNRLHFISQPKVRSTTHLFFNTTKPFVCCGRSTTCTIQRQTSITHRMKGVPSKPPSTQIVARRDTCCLIRLTRLRTRFPPSRSPLLAAVTNTRRTSPRVSTVKNRLRPLISLPPSNPTYWCTLDTLTINDGF